MNNRKLSNFFLLAGMSVIHFGAAAQEKMYPAHVVRADLPAMVSTLIPEETKAFKTTAAGSRKFDHVAYSASISTSSFQEMALPIWEDSTILVNYSGGGGLRPVNFSSLCQVMYPFDTIWNNPTNPDNLGKIKVTTKDSYKIDSVSINGIYLVGTNGGSAVVDTLEITLGIQPAAASWYTTKSSVPKIAPFLPAGKDTMWLAQPYVVDSVRKKLKSYPATAAVYSWKEPLTPAMREVPSSSTTIKRFAFKVPTTFTVPAGNVIMVSYTFRSGDTWNKNKDTIQQRHNFRALFNYPGTSSASDMQPYRWYEGDRSTSSLMFSTFSSRYTTTTFIGATNTPTQFFSQWLVNTITISCATCGLVEKPSSITENSLVAEASAFPNPANDQLHINFTAKEPALVNISLSNMLGQVVSSQDLGKTVAGQQVTATFQTGNLSSGMYFYTIEANGQRLTNRVSVTH